MRIAAALALTAWLAATAAAASAVSEGRCVSGACARAVHAAAHGDMRWGSARSSRGAVSETSRLISGQAGGHEAQAPPGARTLAAPRAPRPPIITTGGQLSAQTQTQVPQIPL